MFFKKPHKLDPVILEIFIVIAIRVKIALHIHTHICLALSATKRTHYSEKEKEIFQQVQKRLIAKLKDYYTRNKDEREWSFWNKDERFFTQRLDFLNNYAFHLIEDLPRSKGTPIDRIVQKAIEISPTYSLGYPIDILRMAAQAEGYDSEYCTKAYFEMLSIYSDLIDERADITQVMFRLHQYYMLHYYMDKYPPHKPLFTMLLSNAKNLFK